MPMVVKTSQHTRTRTLISGFSMSGKTHSLLTFIYGPYDVTDETEYADAMSYAQEQGKHMVVLTMPGETGSRTLPDANDYITPMYFEVASDEDMRSAEWSRHALAELAQTEKEVLRNKPDIMVWDGLHALAMHQFNDISKGEYLAGLDMNASPEGGRVNPYRAANLYDRLCNTFGQTMASIYNTQVPNVVCTVWEDWKGQQSDSERAKGIEATRYLWPDIPGKMATRIVGMFDARVSARLENTCIYADCDDKKHAQKHYVWQFAQAGDVMGVGVKGLTMRKSWRATPFIHQNWHDLKVLMGA